MAELIQCDGCNAISPDPETELHEANKWIYFIVKDRDYYFPRDKEIILCNKCLPGVHRNSYAEQLAKSFIKFFRERIKNDH